MRIPFPERIPLAQAGTFALALFIAQAVEGTALYFSIGTFAFIILTAVAFNTAGGLTRIGGAYICFYSLLVVIIGISYKALLGERGESNLQDPTTTIAAYVASMAGLYVAALLSSRFAGREGALRNVLNDRNLMRASVGCLMFGIVGALIISAFGEGAAKLGSAFQQLNQLVPVGIIMGVMYEIRRSGGTRSTNPPVLIGMLFLFLYYGLFSFSKQGLFTPLFCWFIPVCALRYRVSPLQVAGGLVLLFYFGYYLVPYSQYGRSADTHTSLSSSIATSIDLLTHPNDTRNAYQALVQEGELGVTNYYNTEQGIFDRLQFVAADDALIAVTDRGHVFGLSPIVASFLNIVPHALWANKPALGFGHLYGHEIGVLADDDESTGISFSPTAEAYHMARWIGICVIAPLIWLLLFVVSDLMYGDFRTTPWGLLAVTLIAHLAPETGLTGPIYFVTYGTAILTFCAFFSAYVAPLFATLVMGAGKTKLRPVPVRPIANPGVSS